MQASKRASTVVGELSDRRTGGLVGTVAFIILGLLAGAIAKILLPGRDPGGLIGTTLIGIAGAFNNLGLQAALYQLAPADRMGTATGQFQVFRYVGATLCTALLGIVFSGTATTAGLHLLALMLVPVALALIWASSRAPQ